MFGGFASAVVLSVVAFLLAGESVHRIFVPLPIHFNEAIAIACVALTVNLVCAVLLKEHHHHEHDNHEHHHDHAHNYDLNLGAAYLHVLADAFTTFLAIAALTSANSSAGHCLIRLLVLSEAAWSSLGLMVFFAIRAGSCSIAYPSLPICPRKSVALLKLMGIRS